MMTPEFTTYQRRLPHWRLSGSVYFVTWRLAKDQPGLIPEERSIVKATITHFEGERYSLPAYVVMDDHVHALVLPDDDFELARIVHSWKSYSSQQLTANYNRIAPVWQHEYFDRIVRDNREFEDKAQYILGNPSKKWPSLHEYPWVGIGRDFLEIK